MAYDDEQEYQEQEDDYDPEPVYLDNEPEARTSAPDSDDEVMPSLLDAHLNKGEATRQWYVVHCYSGYENKVRYAIEQRIETMGMQDKIFDVIVPTQEETEIKDGKRRNVERRVFPGYILVEMKMDEDSWYVVRNTPGVTGFVGMGNEPTPLRKEEVEAIIKRMESGVVVPRIDYRVGQKVRIIEGPFNDFVGMVAAIDQEKGKVRVMVNFFGRDTPVELDFQEVEKA
jgi:transcriptional antiterminator NusG